MTPVALCTHDLEDHKQSANDSRVQTLNSCQQTSMWAVTVACLSLGLGKDGEALLRSQPSAYLQACTQSEAGVNAELERQLCPALTWPDNA